MRFRFSPPLSLSMPHFLVFSFFLTCLFNFKTPRLSQFSPRYAFSWHRHFVNFPLTSSSSLDRKRERDLSYSSSWSMRIHCFYSIQMLLLLSHRFKWFLYIQLVFRSFIFIGGSLTNKMRFFKIRTAFLSRATNVKLCANGKPWMRWERLSSFEERQPKEWRWRYTHTQTEKKEERNGIKRRRRKKMETKRQNKTNDTRSWSRVRYSCLKTEVSVCRSTNFKMLAA